MAVINTNVSSLIAQNAMTTNSRSQTTAMQQLSTGLRINGAKDDAAGLAIASRMTAQIKGLDQAVRNSNDAISMLQTADGALSTVGDMLQRMREIAVQSANDTNVGGDRLALNEEFGQLKTEIARVGNTTQWNSMNLLDATSNSGNFTFQIGSNNIADQQVQVHIDSISTPSAATTTAATLVTTPGDNATPLVGTVTIGGTAAVGDKISLTLGTHTLDYTIQQSDYSSTAATFKQNIAHSIGLAIASDTTLSALYTTDGATLGVLEITAAGSGAQNFSSTVTGSGLSILGASNSVDTRPNAQAAIAAVNGAIDTINSARSKFGAYINRFTYAADNLANISQNTSASRSRVQDTDYAKASTELARTQIISQAATAMLAQANQSQQSVLALLK